MSKINIQYSVKTGENQYKPVDELSEATGVSMFRNSATKKSFTNAVAEMKTKFKGTPFSLVSESPDSATFGKTQKLRTIDVLRNDIDLLKKANHDPVLFEDSDDLPF